MKNRMLLIVIIIGLVVGAVSGATPVSNFSSNATNGNSPFHVQFYDNSTNTPTGWSWFFGDETYSQAWVQINASAGWSARRLQSAVILPDGSIVLTGGEDAADNKLNDVWRSEDNGNIWVQINASAGWSPRSYHSSVSMPDGSIVLMGGDDGSIRKNDVWRSTDKGVTWFEVNTSSEWTARVSHSSVALSDGSIVLMGGTDTTGRVNDVWRSTDNGSVWVSMGNAGWTKRSAHSSLAMPDGSIIMMGGFDGTIFTYVNDTWRSTDKGATWIRANASSGWASRSFHSTVVMPDGSIVLSGGFDAGGRQNDVWRSADNGVMWSRIGSEHSAWEDREMHSTVVLANGSILLLGGDNDGSVKLNDVWGLTPIGSASQNPSHIFTGALGNEHFDVSLRSYNTDGFNTTKKDGFIILGDVAYPVASFTSNVSVIDGFYPKTLLFTDTSVTDITSRAWYIGLNTPSSLVGTGATLTHTFPSAGNWAVQLYVSNLTSASNLSQIYWVNLTEPQPTISASISVSKTYGKYPVEINFTDSTTVVNADALVYSWDFNDGTLSNVRNITHEFTTVGSYNVSLTVSNVSRLINSTSYSLVHATPYAKSTWMLLNATAFPARMGAASAITRSGVIFVSGGYRSATNAYLNDVWMSTDYGQTWQLRNASAEFPGRAEHNMEILDDDTIVIVGGRIAGATWDDRAWISTDYGSTWAVAYHFASHDCANGDVTGGWGRASYTDGTNIVVTGGRDECRQMFVDPVYSERAWISPNKGATWILGYRWSDVFDYGRYGHGAVLSRGTEVTFGGLGLIPSPDTVFNDVWWGAAPQTHSTNWTPRYNFAYTVLGNGDIQLMGGQTAANTLLNRYDKSDVWRSTDKGISWVQTDTTTGWGERNLATAVTLPTNATLLIGGSKSGSSQSDVWLNGYTFTGTVVDSETKLPISTVYVTDNFNQTRVTTAGVFTSAYFGETNATFYLSSSGYTPKIVSYVIDEDRTETIEMTVEPVVEAGTKNTWYTMQLVRLKVVDAFGSPLPNATITVNYLASTLPSTDISWLTSAFGVDTTVAAQMTNSSIAMSGTTTNDGSLTFMMFPALTYGVTITNPTLGLNNYRTISPRDTDYVLYCPLSTQIARNNTLTAVTASSLPYYKLNTSYYNLSMIYHDAAGYTTNVRFIVIDYTNGGTTVLDRNWGNPGTGIIVDNYTAYVPMGQEYIWKYNATKV